MSERIIIENRTDKPMSFIMAYVGVVIRQGKNSNNGKAYCSFTSFHDNVHVAAMRNKASDRFVVYERE